MIVDKRMKKDLRAQANNARRRSGKSKAKAKAMTSRYKRRKKIGKRKR
jgi:hypothetical protein